MYTNTSPALDLYCLDLLPRSRSLSGTIDLDRITSKPKKDDRTLKGCRGRIKNTKNRNYASSCKAAAEPAGPQTGATQSLISQFPGPPSEDPTFPPAENKISTEPTLVDPIKPSFPEHGRSKHALAFHHQLWRTNFIAWRDRTLKRLAGENPAFSMESLVSTQAVRRTRRATSSATETKGTPPTHSETGMIRELDRRGPVLKLDPKNYLRDMREMADSLCTCTRREIPSRHMWSLALAGGQLDEFLDVEDDPFMYDSEGDELDLGPDDSFLDNTETSSGPSGDDHSTQESYDQDGKDYQKHMRRLFRAWSGPLGHRAQMN